jgi:hypothetical protein
MKRDGEALILQIGGPAEDPSDTSFLWSIAGGLGQRLLGADSMLDDEVHFSGRVLAAVVELNMAEAAGHSAHTTDDIEFPLTPREASYANTSVLDYLTHLWIIREEQQGGVQTESERQTRELLNETTVFARAPQ